jgi:hypothetical protein
MKALSYAKETYIRINTQGMMCIQHQVTTRNDGGLDNFIDICTVPEEALDEADKRQERKENDDVGVGDDGGDD